jgi:YebC/PmpR family DNA-binding regulatory protein
MSGHSRWSTIKRTKGAADAKRGQLFTKLSKEIAVSARLGGGDPNANPRLRLAIDKARAAMMPSDNVTRAIKKGTGELEGGEVIELTYEGYGPGGVAFIVEATSDNQNRTSADVRNYLEKSGGSLAKAGAVAYNFQKRGMLRYDAARFTEDQVMEAALEAGADDVVTEDQQVVVYTEPSRFHAVKDALDKAGLASLAAELTMIAGSTVAITDADLARRVLKLYEKLEDHDDVQHVHTNFEIAPDLLAQVEES